MGAGMRRANAAAKATRLKPRWCVRHHLGWCATKNGRQHRDDASSVPTKCDHFVVMPMGSERRVPTCIECIEKI